MNKKPHLSETDKVFFNDGYKLGLTAVDQGLDKEAIFTAAQQQYDAMDGLLESLLQHAQQYGKAVACKKGCEHCCYQPVFAISHEIHLLYNYITQHLSPDTQQQVMQRARKLNKERTPLKDDALLHHKAPCPLLQDGSCLAYDARPMACRIYLSTDVASCQRFHTHPADATSIPALLAFPLQAGRMMNEGFSHALKTGDLNSGEFRIEEGLEMMAGNIRIN
jgi:Fe-S-cluster containining protein